MKNKTDWAISAAASIIAENIRETEIKLYLDAIRSADLIKEFSDFHRKNSRLNIFDVCKEFAKLYPEKFFIPDENIKFESYGNFVVLAGDE